ncbi:MAG: hypothetical protein K6E36_02050, partial [Oscillospiraceae bacterium]|nr:hypothetical protein [Oscillospiraceae bacterium]
MGKRAGAGTARNSGDKDAGARISSEVTAESKEKSSRLSPPNSIYEAEQISVLRRIYKHHEKKEERNEGAEGGRKKGDRHNGECR